MDTCLNGYGDEAFRGLHGESRPVANPLKTQLRHPHIIRQYLHIPLEVVVELAIESSNSPSNHLAVPESFITFFH